VPVIVKEEPVPVIAKSVPEPVIVKEEPVPVIVKEEPVPVIAKSVPEPSEPASATAPIPIPQKSVIQTTTIVQEQDPATFVEKNDLLRNEKKNRSKSNKR